MQQQMPTRTTEFTDVKQSIGEICSKCQRQQSLTFRTTENVAS